MLLAIMAMLIRMFLINVKEKELLRPHSDGYGKAVASPMRKNKRRILVIGISVQISNLWLEIVKKTNRISVYSSTVYFPNV